MQRSFICIGDPSAPGGNDKIAAGNSVSCSRCIITAWDAERARIEERVAFWGLTDPAWNFGRSNDSGQRRVYSEICYVEVTHVGKRVL